MRFGPATVNGSTEAIDVRRLEHDAHALQLVLQHDEPIRVVHVGRQHGGHVRLRDNAS